MELSLAEEERLQLARQRLIVAIGSQVRGLEQLAGEPDSFHFELPQGVSLPPVLDELDRALVGLHVARLIDAKSPASYRLRLRLRPTHTLPREDRISAVVSSLRARYPHIQHLGMPPNERKQVWVSHGSQHLDDWYTELYRLAEEAALYCAAEITRQRFTPFKIDAWFRDSSSAPIETYMGYSGPS